MEVSNQIHTLYLTSGKHTLNLHSMWLVNPHNHSHMVVKSKFSGIKLRLFCLKLVTSMNGFSWLLIWRLKAKNAGLFSQL